MITAARYKEVVNRKRGYADGILRRRNEVCDISKGTKKILLKKVRQTG